MKIVSSRLLRTAGKAVKENSLCRRIIFFDGTIDERGDVASGLIALVCRLGYAELVQQFVENLDGAGVLRFDGGHRGGCFFDYRRHFGEVCECRR